ncbi:MAG TPA: dynamin family protein [Smithellaceae bacterium]|nr:dynamin family protein [Smithellaceae bacterium]
MENNSNKITLSHIRDLLQTVHQATDKFQLSSLTRQLEAADNLLLQNPPIDVAVLGQFKAGKSSFLNSLLGQNVLPVGAIPVTTAITRLQYGERERAVVQHFNGKKTEIPLADIVEFTSEAGNPGNEKTWLLQILSCLLYKNIRACGWLIHRDWEVFSSTTKPLQKAGFQPWAPLCLPSVPTGPCPSMIWI